MNIPENLFTRLDASPFRKSFRLKGRELAYFKEKGLHEIMEHAAVFLEERIVPEIIPNDGKQTPMKNHPVFIAQHATATCCRKCIEKWHGIKQGRRLTEEEKKYLLEVIRLRLEKQL